MKGAAPVLPAPVPQAQVREAKEQRRDSRDSASIIAQNLVKRANFHRHDASVVCALLLDAAGYWRRVETCGLEPTIPVPAGFCGGNPGAQTGIAAT